MTTTDLAGKALTVLGPVPGEALGITLPHEHILVDITVAFQEPGSATDRSLAHAPVGPDNLWWVRYHWACNRDNLQLLDEPTAVTEVQRAYLAGARTIVDPTNLGLARDPAGLARIARATGLQIVMGSGHYVGLTHPPALATMSEDAITEEIVRDVTVGVDDTGVRAGLIGEIGCSWPWTETEHKVVRAAVQAQRATGAPLMIHPGRDPAAPMEILNALAKVGADLTRTVMCHIERTVFDWARVREIAATGCFLEYDLFGHESSFYPLGPIDMPNDAQRLDQVFRLAAEGHARQVLLSHDICQKHRLTRYGGHGYHHLLVNVIPQMRRRGATEADLRTLFVDNPRRAFVFT